MTLKSDPTPDHYGARQHLRQPLLHHGPCTLTPEPYTLTPVPYTLTPEPYTQTPEPSL